MVQAINRLQIFILKLRAWELFLLMMIPVLASFLISPETNPLILSLLNILFLIMIIGWLYSIGIVFNNMLCEELRKTDILFKINTVYSLTYIGTLFLNIASLQTKMFDESSFTIVFSIYFIFSWFHCFYFASKALVMYEKDRNIDLENHSKEFFLLIVFAIGIWFLQPRINKLVIISTE